MDGASTLTYNERFSIAMSNVKREFDEVSGFCDYFSARVKVLEAENAKLRDLVRLMVERDDMLLCGHGCTPSTCKAYDSDVCERIGHLSNELGIEMDDDA